jgi:hypothetical protein
MVALREWLAAILKQINRDLLIKYQAMLLKECGLSFMLTSL